MKTPEQEHLLRDVLNADESYNAFRARLRQTMLAEVRRTHRSSGKQQLLALAACVALALAPLWLLQPRKSGHTYPTGVSIVQSIPLKPDQIVTTANHSPHVTVVASRNIEIISPNFEVVRTIGELPPDILTDEQLLDLFKGRAVALVNLATGKKLVFLDEE